jgi:hypothetical protein
MGFNSVRYGLISFRAEILNPDFLITKQKYYLLTVTFDYSATLYNSIFILFYIHIINKTSWGEGEP